MDIECENDTLEDQFLFEVDKSADTGDETFILNAIKLYKGKIDNEYIKIAENILTILLEEKIESMEIN